MTSSHPADILACMETNRHMAYRYAVLECAVLAIALIVMVLVSGAGHCGDGPGISTSGGTEIDIPLAGTVDTAGTSLVATTVMIALLDGFNPCAFFVLFFLLSLLIHARSRKRMAIIGGTFVVFSGLVYFMFMTAWLGLFLSVGRVATLTKAAGAVALVVAAINIKDFFFFKRGITLGIPEGAKPGLFDRMRALVRSASTASMLAGAAVLALAANSYELLCTAGFPMVYTRVLTLHKLPWAGYYGYLALYNLVYMLPLAGIVAAFAFTLGARKLTEWQGRVLKLVSGVMMLAMGAVLLANPGLLTNAATAALILACALVVSGITVAAYKKLSPGGLLDR